MGVAVPVAKEYAVGFFLYLHRATVRMDFLGGRDVGQVQTGAEASDDDANLPGDGVAGQRICSRKSAASGRARNATIDQDYPCGLVLFGQAVGVGWGGSSAHF